MIKKALTLSIIIPTYNEENHLKACLWAISKQSVKPDQVVVVDNNSTDRTEAIARSFRFVTVIKEKRQGLFFARGRGFDCAKHDVLCRIDADTIVEHDWVEQVKNAFETSELQAITGPVGYYDMPFPSFTMNVEDKFLRFAKLGKYQFLMGANMALRRSAWLSIRSELCNQPFIFEDIDLAVHLRSKGISPGYVSAMRANVSSRRLADKPIDFMRYIGGHTRTLEYHGLMAPFGAHLAESAFVSAYLIIKPLYMAFDPNLRRPSLTYLLESREARPDPMMVS